jgi:hypothetical protein
MYEMATGERPLMGDTPISTITSILRNMPISIGGLKPEYSMRRPPSPSGSWTSGRPRTVPFCESSSRTNAELYGLQAAAIRSLAPEPWPHDAVIGGEPFVPR